MAIITGCEAVPPSEAYTMNNTNDDGTTAVPAMTSAERIVGVRAPLSPRDRVLY